MSDDDPPKISSRELRAMMAPEDYVDLMRRRRLNRLEIEAAKSVERDKKRAAVAQRKLEREWERRRKKAARLLLYGDHSAPEEKWEPPDNSRE
jgi:hypothetical protein